MSGIKTECGVTSSVSMDAILTAVAEELHSLTAREESRRAAESETEVLPEKEEKKKPQSLFGAVGGLFGLDDDVEALRHALEETNRALEELQKELATERERAQSAERALKEQSEKVEKALSALREENELIHMRVFDNRVRIGEVKEQLDNQLILSRDSMTEQAVEK